MTLTRRGDALTCEGDEPRSADYDAGWNDCAVHSVKVIERLEARLSTTIPGAVGRIEVLEAALRAVRGPIKLGLDLDYERAAEVIDAALRAGRR